MISIKPINAHEFSPKDEKMLQMKPIELKNDSLESQKADHATKLLNDRNETLGLINEEITEQKSVNTHESKVSNNSNTK